MSMKINKLEIENVKRVKAVKITPSQNGLTIVGGKNGQGKTSVLDSIAWALGGNYYRPSQANREGSAIPPRLKITMSNGLVVERKGKNSDLKVLDPSGQKAGQQLLDSFVEELAINLPKFLEASNKEKANTLLQIVGVGQQLYELEQEEKRIYNERLAVGQIELQKKKFADEQTSYPNAPKDLVSAYDLIQQQQQILAQNGENQRKRQELSQIQQRHNFELQELDRLNKQLQELTIKHQKTVSDLEIANKEASQLVDETTEELEKNIREVEEINRLVRANLDKEKAEEDAKMYKEQYNSLTAKLENVRKQKNDLLNNADLPLPDLSVEEGELIYKKQKWDNMSSSEQLRVATAIVRKLKPNCGFVLIDKLEQMDIDTLNEFGAWFEQEGLQAIATRVSTGDECSIVIEDGYAVEQDESISQSNMWKEGEF